MKRSLLPALLFGPVLPWLFVGCGVLAPTPAALPPITITPRPTATALPTATPTPRPPATLPPAPTPTPSSGYYRSPELGFWFVYPESWAREETGQDFPTVIINDNDDPVRLLAGARPVEAGTELETFARSIGKDLGLADKVEFVSDSPASLAEGVPARLVTFAWQDEEGHDFQAQGYAALSNGKGYALVLVAHPEVLAARTHTLEALGHGLHLEQPELYGVSRANALVLLHPDITTLDPALTREGADGLAAHLFSGLVRLNADAQVEPDLAERWEVSADGTVYTFHLRAGLKFRRGRPLTASDVKRSWERATDPALKSPTAPLYLGDIQGAAARLAGQAGTLSGVEVQDDQTLVVRLDGPKPYFLAKLAQPVAAVVPVDDAAKSVDWWQDPDSTGPFAVRRWRKGEVLILEQNAAYPQPPAVKAILYFLFGGSGFAAYEASQVDVATVDTAHLARALDPADPLSGDVVKGMPFCTYRVVFDITQPPFNDPVVRQAFALAINREQLARVVLGGAGVPATGLLPPGMPGYLERPVPDVFNAERARALLQQATQGKTLPAIIFTAPGKGDPEPLVVALVDMWKATLGVDIQTTLLERANYATAVATQHGQFFLDLQCAAYADPENVLDLPYHSQSSANLGGYTNAKLDGLLEQARTEADSARRLELYQQAEALLLEELPAVSIVHPLTYRLVQPYVQGYRSAPIPVLWPISVSLER